MSEVAAGLALHRHTAHIARLNGVILAYGKTRALDGVNLELPAGRMIGLIGPDGVGKSSLLSLIAGARAVQEGYIEVLGGDIANVHHRQSAYPRIAYMPQGLGKNLYPTLSVFENIDFFGRLFGHGRDERRRRIDNLLQRTGMRAFANRPVGKLSGGMKQKTGLCCALIHDPDLLILDEPTTGVDPLSRRQFWKLIDDIRRDRPGMTIIVATAYMAEAEHFDLLVALDAGRILAVDTPAALMKRVDVQDLDSAFIALLPEERRRGHKSVIIPPRGADGEVAIEAKHLTMRFGEFTAVDDVSFRIRSGEIFGFLGSNGCGKTTTMKMLTGLLPASAGKAELFGRPVDPNDVEVRRRVGYMSQAFSLYTELTVRQNLDLHARLFSMPADIIPRRIEEMAGRFGLELCDRVSLMHAGKVLVSDTPAAIINNHSAETLEEAFIGYLEDAIGKPETLMAPPAQPPVVPAGDLETQATRRRQAGQLFDLSRMFAYTRREALELRRDPIRATLAILGSVILMFVIGYGINMDVENLSFAVLDHDDTTISRDYTLQISGSHYFTEKPPIADYADLDRRMRDGEVSLAMEIPPGFGRDVAHGRKVEIGAWIDGAMPMRAERVLGYVRGMHASWLKQKARELYGDAAAVADFQVELRYRYNPDIKSLVAIVPAVIPLLLLMIPAMLAALSVVREKELGSIINFYVTPVTRLEFLVGKQLPYIGLALLNFLMLTAFAILFFRVPLTGSFPMPAAAALLYVIVTTGMGLLISSFMSSQIAAIFGTALITLIPAVQYSGMIDPVSSLQGAGAVIGRLYPTAYFMTISRGAFSKALDFGDLAGAFFPLLVAIPILLGLGAFLLKKQAV